MAIECPTDPDSASITSVSNVIAAFVNNKQEAAASDCADEWERKSSFTPSIYHDDGVRFYREAMNAHSLAAKRRKNEGNIISSNKYSDRHIATAKKVLIPFFGRIAKPNEKMLANAKVKVTLQELIDALFEEKKYDQVVDVIEEFDKPAQFLLPQTLSVWANAVHSCGGGPDENQCAPKNRRKCVGQIDHLLKFLPEIEKHLTVTKKAENAINKLKKVRRGCLHGR